MNPSAFDPNVKTRFTELSRDSLRALKKILKSLHWTQRAAFDIMVRYETDFNFIPRVEAARNFCQTEDFELLLTYVLDQPSLCNCLIADSAKDLTDAAVRTVFRTYAKLIIGRAICIAGADPDEKTSEALLQQFCDFLFSGTVKRKVTVPLIHLNLDNDRYDVGELGTIERTVTPPTEMVPAEISRFLFSNPNCQLTFQIETQPFLSAKFVPVGEMLRLRTAVLRLAVDPLISYNHFYVEHYQPWEIPLRDADFHSRFWSQPGEKVSIAARLFTNDHVEKVRRAWPQFVEMKWNAVTPWHLAMNRLDDAIFKLESGSPDAVMDLVIGLGSIFVERESRNESTYKVATRVARFLGTDDVSRKQVFTQAKELYKLRSKLAHGQPWTMDAEGITKVEAAAVLLGRVLSSMLQHKETTLDLVSVDLN